MFKPKIYIRFIMFSLESNYSFATKQYKTAINYFCSPNVPSFSKYIPNYYYTVDLAINILISNLY